jgi:hypothetical protein
MRSGGILATTIRFILAALIVAATTGACTGDSDVPAVAFWDYLRTLCGRSFSGQPVEISALDSAVVGRSLVVNIWQCWNDEVRIAFHVGDDHSRVWVLSWDEGRLALQHAVHTADGERAEFTNYGGVAVEPGTPSVQTFAPAAETLLRFPSAAGSSWTLEIVPGDRFTYRFVAVDRSQRFRVDFDLTAPAPRPPAPWGWTRNSRPAPPTSR